MIRLEKCVQLVKRPQNEENTRNLFRVFAYSEGYEYAKHEVAGFINKYIQRKTEEGFNKWS